jgi:hypothetical protein
VKASLSAAFPGKVPRGDQSERRDSKAALSNIPIRAPLHFMGRDDALTAIEAALKRYEGRVAITALHGLRGVGKTTLAAAYAERHRGDYRATWWARAQTTSTLRADLVALGVRLGWVSMDDKEEMAVDTVMERLRHEGEGILLIFDNAVDANALNDYLPRGGAAKVLVTSNAPNFAPPALIEVVLARPATFCCPPSSVALMAVPPDDTVSMPKLQATALVAMPPERTLCRPPVLIVAPTTVPATVSVPPLMIEPLAVPCASTTCDPVKMVAPPARP